MAELAQLAPLLQSGILIAGLFIVVFFARMLKDMHNEAMSEMRSTSTALILIAKALEGLSIRVETLHTDVREIQKSIPEQIKRGISGGGLGI